MSKQFLCKGSADAATGKVSDLICTEIPQRLVVNARQHQLQQNQNCQETTDCLCDLNSEQFSDALIDMRLLWDDHFFYTRLAVEETVVNGLNSPQSVAIVNRLLQNQDQLGDNLAIFYCDANGAQYASILREHIEYAVEVLKILRNPTSPTYAQDLAAAEAEALENAREFAQFWACINRFADEEHVFEHMQHHILTLVDLMKAIVARNTPLVISTQDVYSAATREMSAYFADIIQQQWENECNQSSSSSSSSSSSTCWTILRQKPKISLYNDIYVNKHLVILTIIQMKKNLTSNHNLKNGYMLKLECILEWDGRIIDCAGKYRFLIFANA